MLLSRDSILEHIKKGTIAIDPFHDNNLKTTSYDVTLGEWFYRENHPAGRTTVHNIYDEDSTAFIWTGPHAAERASAIEERLQIKLKNIPPAAKVILLAPGETILGHTNEFIGGRDICVAKMYARSSLGRNFIEVCKDAGWGDIGYINRWTMEITNNSQHFTIPLVVGRRIAQMVFYEVAPLKGNKADYVQDAGKYQHASELKQLKLEWKPEMMLPKMQLDWEIKAGK